MSTLKFTDGEEFNTGGELRCEERYDGWYVLGNGVLMPVKSQAEGLVLIDKLKPKWESMSEDERFEVIQKMGYEFVKGSNIIKLQKEGRRKK